MKKHQPFHGAAGSKMKKKTPILSKTVKCKNCLRNVLKNKTDLSKRVFTGNRLRNGCFLFLYKKSHNF